MKENNFLKREEAVFLRFVLLLFFLQLLIESDQVQKPCNKGKSWPTQITSHSWISLGQ